MHTIKFRAWNKEKKEMVWFGMTLEDIAEHEKETNFTMLEIMQFTGLLDKNGKEIYEGDVVAEQESVMSDMGEDKQDYIDKRIVTNFQYATGEIGERRFGRKIHNVRWSGRSCGFEPFSDSDENCGHCGGGIIPENVEVIGDIYSNPELLHQEEVRE